MVSLRRIMRRNSQHFPRQLTAQKMKHYGEHYAIARSQRIRPHKYKGLQTSRSASNIQIFYHYKPILQTNNNTTELEKRLQSLFSKMVHIHIAKAIGGLAYSVQHIKCMPELLTTNAYCRHHLAQLKKQSKLHALIQSLH